MRLATKYVWVLAHYDETKGVYTRRCYDADINDASLIHPTEVTQWDCYDEETSDFTRTYGATATCGCVGDCSGEFYVDADWFWEDFDSFDGCYEDAIWTKNDLPMYFKDKSIQQDAVVYATSVFGSTVSQGHGHAYISVDVLLGVLLTAPGRSKPQVISELASFIEGVKAELT